MLWPALTSEDGAAFLRTAMTRRFTGRVAVLQTDGARSSKAPLPNRLVSIVIGTASPGRSGECVPRVARIERPVPPAAAHSSGRSVGIQNRFQLAPADDFSFQQNPGAFD